METDNEDPGDAAFDTKANIARAWDQSAEQLRPPCG